MTKISTIFIVLGIALVGGANTGCFDPFFYGTRAGGNLDLGTVTYEGDVYPILLARCASCHETGLSAGDTAFVLSSNPAADYSAISVLVTAGDPAGSLLLQMASGAATHSGGGLLAESSVDYQTLEAWVEQGAAQQ